MDKTRCKWATDVVAVYQEYHDHQWGVPVYDDHTLFEMLILESFHSGLSWLIVLKKRDNFRAAFDQFDIDKIMRYDDEKVEALMGNAGIIRNRAKIEAAIANANAVKEIQQEYGSFSEYIWSWTDHKSIKNTDDEFRDRTELSDTIAKDMKKRGMKFLGSVTVYAYLQAIGVVNDHETTCFCYERN